MKKKLTAVIFVLMVFLTSCGLFQDDNTCHTSEENLATSDGYLIKTECNNNGVINYGLINKDMEYVTSEKYYNISVGNLPVRYGFSNYVFEDTLYLRVVKEVDDDFLIGVIDQGGNEILMDDYQELIISDTYAYIKDKQNYIINLETMEKRYVDYDIIYHAGFAIRDLNQTTYIAYDDNMQFIIINDRFEEVDFKPVDMYIYYSEDKYIYTLDDTLYQYDFTMHEEIELLNIIDEPDYTFDITYTYLILNPNTGPIYIRISDMARYELVDQCEMFNFSSKYQVLYCDNRFEVYDIDTFEKIKTISETNTEFINNSPLYISYELPNKVSNIDKTVPFKDQLVRYDTYFNYIVFEFEDYKSYYDFNLNKLFEAELTCEPLVSPSGTDVFLYASSCEITNPSDDVHMIKITNASFDLDNTVIRYYTDEFVYLSEKNNTILIDYEGNVLFD